MTKNLFSKRKYHKDFKSLLVVFIVMIILIGAGKLELGGSTFSLGVD